MNNNLQVLKRSAPALVSLFSSMFTMVQVFPYLPWMVQHLIPGLDEKNIGYYSGLIASSQFVGRTFGSFLWGWLADKYGRKIIMISSGILLAFATFCYGFSSTVFIAIVFRFLVGFFNGIIPAGKAAISDYSDDTTQPFAMGFLGAAFSLGLVFGSGFSGLLADPIAQYDIPRYRLFVKYPYVLPGIANACILLIGVVVVYFFMEESSNKKPAEEEPSIVSPNTGDGGVYSSGEERESDGMLHTRPVRNKGILFRFISMLRESVFYELITDWLVILLLLLYSLFSVVVLSLDEVLPLWSKVPREIGGLAMSIRKFSIVISISALVCFPFSLFIFQAFERCLGGLRSYLVALLCLIPVCVLMPSISVLPGIASSLLLGIFNIFLRLFVSAVFAALSMFVNNSVTPDKLGAVNGLCISICSIFRSFAPIYGGSVFAISLNNHTFPLDYHLVFVINGFVLILCILFGTVLPESLNRKKKVQSKTSVAE